MSLTKSHALTTEVYPVAGGTGMGVLIDHDMTVMPRCGSCMEPLFASYVWASVTRGADDMVRTGTPRDEVLDGLVSLLQATYKDHSCFGNHEIQEEP